MPQSGLTVPIRTIGNDVEVMIRPEEVVAQLDAIKPFVDVLLYVFDANGAAVEGMRKRITFNERLKKSGPIIIRESFDLPAGNYVVKGIARIEGTASTGFAKTALTVK